MASLFLCILLYIEGKIMDERKQNIPVSRMERMPMVSSR